MALMAAVVPLGAVAEPTPLNDQQMDQVTAGNTGGYHQSTATGGIIIANESDATVADSASVSLQDNVQINARALSLVSSADGLVASGLNLWDGTLQEISVGSEISVSQANVLSQQESPLFARLLDYERDAETLRDVRTFADSTAPIQTIKLALQLDIDGIGSFDARGEVPASVIPTSKIPGAFGNVVGFAGELGIEFDGGAFEVDVDLASALEGGTHLGAEGESTSFFGLVTLGHTELSSTTQVSASFNPHLRIAMELPDLSILGEGAVCYANGGECRSSVLDQMLAELDVDLAEAEYIVIDRSALNASDTYSVDLGGEAQANTRSVTLVNSAGGLVASGANIASVSDTSFLEAEESSESSSRLATPILNLEQDNILRQMQAKGRGESNHHRDGRSDVGGAIIADESAASIAENTSVNIDSAAQTGARAVSLVNSANALVANGVNIWDGRLQEGDFGTRTDIRQNNELKQQASQTAARLSDYDRGSETLHHVTTHAKSAATPKSISVDLALEILNPATPDPDDTLGTLNFSIEIPASIIPSSKVPGVGGTVAAFAGNVDVELDGGSAELDLGIDDSGLHFQTDNSVTGGTGDFGGFTLISADADATFTNTIDATIDSSFTVAVDMPDLKIETDGAVCFAQKGNCEAGVSDLEIGALDFSSAEAEYIVIDRSELATETSNSVALSQSAQADARAVSLVNVAGGLVANGLNIASLRGEELLLSTPMLNLAQHNSVTQAAGSPSRWEPGLGGVIVANESSASFTETASVALSSNAQEAVRGVSIVNSADAMVANGVNLWVGNFAQAEFNSVTNLSQANDLTQRTSQAIARLHDYSRGAQTLRDAQTTATTKPDTDATDEFFPEANAKFISGEFAVKIDNIVNFEGQGQFPLDIIPTSKIPGGKPIGVAFAGDAFVDYDGGAIDLNFTNENHFSSDTTATVDGEVQAFFGILKGSGHSSFEDHIAVDLATELRVVADLPDLTIDVEGTGCITRGGDCSATLLKQETGAVNIASAQAENIVVDGSELTSANDHSVSLDEFAQADARALVMVNAAGGLIANGVNVSHVAGAELSTPKLNLDQRNTVIQGDSQRANDHRPGSRAGGAIVANDSSASFATTATLNLSHSAQAGARALVIVNAADALVGNGVNLWDGNLNQADFGNSINVEQTNRLVQHLTPTSAQLYDYSRDGGTLRDVYTLADSRVVPQFIKAGFKVQVPEVGSASVGVIVPASAIPTSKVPGAHGIVAGFAGEANLLYGGGSAEVFFGMNDHLELSNSTMTEVAAGDFLGFGSTTGSAEFSSDLSLDFAPTLSFATDLPTLSIHAKGALCWANGGECSSGIFEQEIGELNIDEANAEHIVVDHAALTATENYAIALDSSAQANARAMTIINAVGGLVASAINVSSSRGATLNTPALNLVQRNVVVQGH